MQRKNAPKQALQFPIPRSVSPTAASLQRSSSAPVPDVPSTAQPAGAAQHAAGSAAALQQRRLSLAALERRRLQQPTIAPGQPGVSDRNREKRVTLPESSAFARAATSEEEDLAAPPASLFQDLELQPDLASGRISVTCVSDALDRKRLEAQLRAKGTGWLQAQYPDVLYGQYCAPGRAPAGDIFYFDYGVIAVWGLSREQEQEVLRAVVPSCAIMPLRRKDVEVDTLTFKYVVADLPNIQNDTVSIGYRLAGDHKMKLAICFAISQSTKLSVYEEKIVEVVEATKDIPEELATKGTISASRKTVTKLIGEVFIQKSEVNLLSTVLDTPEFFWGESDKYEALYRSVIEYLEFDERVEVLNNRFQVLQEMLEIAISQQTVAHTAQLDLVVIYLILLDLVTLLMQLAGSLYRVHT